jgi:lysozyme family protein
MDNFLGAFERTMAFEGGYVLHRNPGEKGLTYAGIYQAAHPGWPGWKLISEQGERAPGLTQMVRQFYRAEFWERIRGDDLPQIIAEDLYDMAVNAGVGRAVKLAQRLAGVAQDGGIGPVTVEALTKIPPGEFRAAYLIARINYYTGLANADPRGKGQFLRGWVNRALKCAEVMA